MKPSVPRLVLFISGVIASVWVIIGGPIFIPIGIVWACLIFCCGGVFVEAEWLLINRVRKKDKEKEKKADMYYV